MNLIKYTPTLSYHVNEKQTVYFYVLFSLAFFTLAHPFPSLHLMYTKTVAITYIPVYLYSSSIDMTMYWYASGLLTCCVVWQRLCMVYIGQPKTCLLIYHFHVFVVIFASQICCCFYPWVLSLLTNLFFCCFFFLFWFFLASWTNLFKIIYLPAASHMYLYILGQAQVSKK